MCRFLSFISCFILIVYVSCALNPPVINTSTGKIQGYFKHSTQGRRFAAFEGIPYAKPPVGKHRFREPEPLSSWEGIWPADTIYKCMQYFHYTKEGEDYVIGDEDCLYLNIYTPEINQLALLDVIIFIHGGAFMFNNGGTYGPKILMDRNVVYVSLNYRLGPLGFLSTEDQILPGNNGLKDQLLALKWIKENIQYFGGNPESITLSGMSAGGASVELHILSPLSTGLFHRGIIQSGTALSPWVLVENSLEKAQHLANILGCPQNSNKHMVDCLKRRPGLQIVSAVKHFQPWLYNPFSPFGVVIDKWSREPFLPEHPIILFKKNKLQNLPVIFSNVQSEGLYPAADFIAKTEYLEDINGKWNELMPFILDYNLTINPQQRDVISQKIRSVYFGNDSVSEETFPNLIKLISDRLFISNIEQAAKLHSEAISSNTYYYYFSYRGAHSKSEQRSLTNKNYGASHGDDTVYVLSSDVNTQTTELDRQMSKILVDMWTSFANDSTPLLPNITWTPLSKLPTDDLEIAKINSPIDIQMIKTNTLGNRDFWLGLPLKENEKLFMQKDEL